jgi:uncharacterized protein YlxW (UPF0749 family)
MSDESESGPRRKSQLGWLTALLFGLGGLLFAISGHDAQGTDLRPGRYTDLAGLVEADSNRVDGLLSQVTELDAQVRFLTASVDSDEVQSLRNRAQPLRAAAGIDEITGPAVTVTLSDAAEEVINTSTQDLNLLVVHQQDIQAVVNAMWRGGAEAISIQGQRIIATTGIKCQGNAVQLAGIPYAQPYVITAVGDQANILQAIETDSYLETFLTQALQPDIRVGWNLATSSNYVMPAYVGSVSMRHAKALPTAD